MLRLLPSLDQKPLGVEGLRIYLLLIELLHTVLKHTRQQRIKLAVAVANAVTRLSNESLQIIGMLPIPTTTIIHGNFKALLPAVFTFANVIVFFRRLVVLSVTLHHDSTH